MGVCVCVFDELGLIRKTLYHKDDDIIRIFLHTRTLIYKRNSSALSLWFNRIEVATSTRLRMFY